MSRATAEPTEAALLAAIKARALPRHVAIIMDGNGRWARQRGLPRIAGHREGVKAARETVRAAGRLGLGYLTLYAFSAENWSRPASEVEFLMELLESSIERELPELMEANVRLKVIGRLGALAPSVRRGVVRAIEATAANTGLTLIIALNYGGRQELIEAIRALGRRIAAGELVPDAIEEAHLVQHLGTRGVPDPDLLIRTSGEMRISNFLLWQIAYTEIWVTPTLWPDFSARDLYQALADFQQRSRRFGGV